jgi:hypothetical protein
MDCVDTNLLDPAKLAEVEQRYRASLTSEIVIDHSARIAELDREIQNIGDAIAKGLISEALAARLRAAEAERTRLLATRDKPHAQPRNLSEATIEGRVQALREKLAEGGEAARSILLELFPYSIQLEPDDSGRHLWAVFVDDFEATRISLLYDTREARLDANAAATLAAFGTVENNASRWVLISRPPSPTRT